MGEVYRARDTRLGRDVAIKVLPEQLSSSEEMRQRFEREARQSRSCRTPISAPSTTLARTRASSTSSWSTWKARRSRRAWPGGCGDPFDRKHTPRPGRPPGEPCCPRPVASRPSRPDGSSRFRRGSRFPGCRRSIAHRGSPSDSRHPVFEASQPVRIGGEGSRQHLDRHLPPQPRVPRLVHLPHPARAKRGDDLVGAETRPGDHAHLNPGSLRLVQPWTG